MMHSIKSLSPLKHDLKLGVPKISSQNTHEVKSSNDPKNKISKLSSTLSPYSKKLLAYKTDKLKSKLFEKHELLSKSALKMSIDPLDERNAVHSKKRKSDNLISSGKKPVKYQSKKPNSKALYSRDNASYICKFCCRRFSSEKLLKDHSVSHENKSSYICYICNYEAACFSALMTHVVKHSRKSEKSSQEMHHNSTNSTSDKIKGIFHCNQCKSSFSSSQKLSDHICPDLQKSEYMCAYCGQVSTSVEQYRCHVQSHSVTPFMCYHCKLKLPTKKLLDKHYESCKRKPKLKFKCDKCSFECKGKRELNQHKKVCKSYQEVPSYECSLCKLSFVLIKDYDVHVSTCEISSLASDKVVNSENLQNLNKSKKISYLCSLCGEQFKSKLDHIKHEQSCSFASKSTSHDKKSILCPTCGDILDALFFEEHSKKCFGCPTPVCSQNKISPNKLSSNEDKDSPNTRRSARLVGRKSLLSSEEDIKKEIPKTMRLKKLKIINKIKGRKGRQSKLGKENFMCGECSLTFCSKSTLLRHKRMHSGNPWFSCKYCGKYFFRKDVFNRHEMNVHSKNIKNVFCCYYCKLFFNAAILLKEHVAATHKENSFLNVKPNAPIENLSSEEADSHIQVKQEVVHSEYLEKNSFLENQVTIDQSIKIQNSSLSAYSISPFKKCGICFQTFETTSEMEDHLLSHPIPDSLENVPQEEMEDFSKLPESHKSLDSSVDFKKDYSKVECMDSQTDVTSTDLPLKENTDQLVSSSDEIASENLLENSIVQAPEIEKHECKLCLKVFSNKKSLESHKKEKHIMIDWYQCLVCDASGAKRDMVEHMFMHMYQVGTFVVTNNHQDLNSILSYLKESNVEKQSDVLCSSPELDINIQPAMSDSEALDIELPKLSYFGTPNKIVENKLSPHSNKESLNKNTSLTSESEQKELTNNVLLYQDLKSDSENISFNVKNNDELHKSDESNKKEFIYCDLDKDNILNNNLTPVLDTSVNTNIENFQDRFQELRRILKEDNKSLKETSASLKTSNEGNSSENQTFSQLRLLLENKNKIDYSVKDNKINENIENNEFSVTPSVSEKGSDVVPPMTNLVQEIESFNNFVSENVQSSSIIEEENFKSSHETEKNNIFHINQIPSTCLKLDINQSRGEFAERVEPTFKLKYLESHRNEKMSHIFQPANSPGAAILDFSDLLKISDSTNASENIFELTSQSSGMLGLSSNSSSNVASRLQDKNPVDLTCPLGFSSFSATTNELKCRKCTESFKSYNELMKHQCRKNIFEQIIPHKSTTNFQLPFDLTKFTLEEHTESSKEKQISLESLNNKSAFAELICCICRKLLKNTFSLEQHYHTEHSNYNNHVLPSNKCIHCHQSFFSFADFTNHCLYCLKNSWDSYHMSDSIKDQAEVQAFPTKTDSHSLVNSKTSSESQEFSYDDSILNLSCNSFGS